MAISALSNPTYSNPAQSFGAGLSSVSSSNPAFNVLKKYMPGSSSVGGSVSPNSTTLPAPTQSMQSNPTSAAQITLASGNSTPASIQAAKVTRAVNKSSVAPANSPNALQGYLGASYVAPNSVDMTATNKDLNAQTQSYQGTENWTKNAALNALANGQRAAGAASQLGNLSPGSASYLSNWRQATTTGMRNLNDIMTNWQQGLSNIYGQQAGAQQSAATTNAGFKQSANLANAARAGQLQDQTTAANSTQNANTVTNNISSINSGLASAGITPGTGGKKGSGVSNARATDLENAYSNATTDQEKQAAYAALQNYAKNVAAIGQAFNAAAQKGGGNVGGYNIQSDGHNHYFIKGPDGKIKQFNNKTDAQKYLEQQGVYG